MHAEGKIDQTDGAVGDGAFAPDNWLHEEPVSEAEPIVTVQVPRKPTALSNKMRTKIGRKTKMIKMCQTNK